MKIYALKRKDGGVEIMFTAIRPTDCLAKWHPKRLAELTGEIREISPDDLPKDRKDRNKWRDDGTCITK